MKRMIDMSREEQEEEARKYIAGWKETHPSEYMSVDEAIVLCFDSEEERECVTCEEGYSCPHHGDD